MGVHANDCTNFYRVRVDRPQQRSTSDAEVEFRVFSKRLTTGLLKWWVIMPRGALPPLFPMKTFAIFPPRSMLFPVNLVRLSQASFHHQVFLNSPRGCCPHMDVYFLAKNLLLMQRSSSQLSPLPAHSHSRIKQAFTCLLSGLCLFSTYTPQQCTSLPQPSLWGYSVFSASLMPLRTKRS